MNKISIKSLLKDCYDHLWEGYKDLPLAGRGYDVVDNLYKGSLLFVGLNPATGKEIKEERLFEGIKEKNYPKYFNAFDSIAKCCGVGYHYSYLDILAIRSTNQKEIKDNMAKIPRLKDFCQKQISLSLGMMEKAKPQVIAVCNAFACDLLKVHPGFQTQFDKMIGTYRITSKNELEHTPVFFSGMLSGKHALDKGSFERLVWHIKQIVNRE